MKTSIRLSKAFWTVLLLLALSSSFLFACPGGNIIYVDQSATAGANDGSSWTNAFTDLQEAIDSAHACANINTMYVAHGIYRPTKEFTSGEPASKTFFFSKNLNVYGGFVGGELGPENRPMLNGELDPAYYTILNGDLDRNDIYNADSTVIIEISGFGLDNASHVVTVDNTIEDNGYIELNGFVVTGGFGLGPLGSSVNTGGGLYILGSSPAPYETRLLVQNCLFRKNIAGTRGGAVFCKGDADVAFQNCYFFENLATTQGGAVAILGPEDGILESPSFTFSRCVFKGNQAFNRAGAVWTRNNINSISSLNLEFFNCLFSGNNGSDIGVIDVTGNNNAHNTKIINCTFAGNGQTVVRSEGNAALVKVFNTIIAHNDLDGRPVIEELANGTFDIRHSNIQDWTPTATNFSEDPFFIAPHDGFIPNILGNYRTQPCAGGEDKGNTALIENSSGLFSSFTDLSQDLVGNSRLEFGQFVSSVLDTPIVDLGAWENKGAVLFQATKDSTDAFIELHWEADKNLCDCFDQDEILQRGVTIELRSGPTLIDSWNIFPEDINGDIYEFDYQHAVGPDTNITYSLEFRKTGPGTLNCRRTDFGSTIPFRPVERRFISNGFYPAVIETNWRNKSKLTDKLNLYRNGTLIHTFDAGNQLDKHFRHVDWFAFDDPLSLVNGSIDTYCIETVSDIYFDIYGTTIPQQTCVIGRTKPINLQATDDDFTDKVVLTWNNVAGHADQIRIVRDGEFIAVVDKSVTTYEDNMPIYGKASIYGIELVLNDVREVGAYDVGSVPKNGVIGGLVLSSNQKSPVQDVTIVMSWMESDTLKLDSTTTNYLGEFEFTDLYYDRSNIFTLMAVKTGETFEFNPQETTLDLDNPVSENTIFLMDKTLDDIGQLDMNISFTATPDAASDLVDLDWQFQKNNSTDTIYFNLYRGSDLIHQIADVQPSTNNIQYAFSDLPGVPGASYNYALTAFTRSTNQLTDTTLEATVNFPVVSPIFDLTAVPDVSKGIVFLDWTHTSPNFDGFRVYSEVGSVRRLVAEVATANSNSIDDNGIPGASTDYYVTAFRTIEGVDYESIPFGPVTAIFPPLTSIDLSDVTPRPAKDIVRLRFDVPAIYGTTYAYDGVRIIRTAGGESTVLEVIQKDRLPAGQTIEFNDRTGVPLASYTYEVRPFVERADSIYESIGLGATVNFPPVSIPRDVTTTSFEGKIEINWRSPHTSNNMDGFIVYKGTGANPDSIGTIPFQYENRFNDYITNPPNSASETYQVRTIRYVDGQRYLSNAVSVLADPPLVNGDEAIHLADFIATRDQANHIKLCWEWNSVANQSPFILRREGVVIDTLSNEIRSYYDYDAPVQSDVEYSLETPGIFYTDTIQKVFTLGFMPGNKMVNGRIYNLNNSAGLANHSVMIELMNTTNGSDKFTKKTVSNAAGYYQIQGLPIPTATGNYTGTVTVIDSTNNQFIENPQNISLVFSDANSITEINFIDVMLNETSEENMAQIDTAIAVPDPFNLAIQLNWSPTNENYDGFEIFRGHTRIGEVLKGSSLIWTDRKGFPGLSTVYSVRAFRSTSSGLEFSAFEYATAEYPILAPVEFLTANPLFDQNKLIIQWSHPYNNHDDYIVTRNEETIAIVQTGSGLFFIDSTAIPGELYNYEITARQGIIFSSPVSIQARYPDAATLNVINLSSPDTMIATVAGGPLSTHSMNHLRIQWDYAQGAADGFMILRYIVQGADKVDEKILARLPGASRSYQDFSGLPNQLYHYEVVPMLIRGNMEYFAQRQSSFAESMVFPRLSPPANVDFTAFTDLCYLNGRFNILFDGYDGYQINRQPDALAINSLDTVFGDGYQVSFDDRTGRPSNIGSSGQDYSYSIFLYATRGNQIFTSDTVELVETYPEQPTPANFSASDGTFPNKIELEWTYNIEIPVDHFELWRDIGNGLELIESMILPGDRTYTDFDPAFLIPPDQYFAVQYELIAVNQDRTSAPAVDNGSLYSGILSDGIVASGRRLGESVDIDGEWAVAGTNGHGFHIYQLMDDNTWRLDTVIIPSDVGAIAGSDKFGAQVSISGEYIATSAVNQFYNFGVVYIFHRLNNKWGLQKSIFQTVGPSTVNNGIALDIYDGTRLGAKDHLVFSSRLQAGTEPYGIFVYQRQGNDWIQTDDYLGFSAVPIPNGFGLDVSIYKTRVGVVADNDRIYYFSLDQNGTLTAEQILFSSNVKVIDIDENTMIAGASSSNRVALYSIANDVVQIPPYDINEIFTGKSVGVKGDYAISGENSDDNVRLIQRDGSNWNHNLSYADPHLNTNRYGLASAVSESHYMISARDFNNDQGAVVFIPTGGVEPPENVDATDGTNPGQVRVTWDEPQPINNITSYTVYRDGELLGIVNSAGGPGGNGLSYIDLPSAGLIPGKHYTYAVTSNYGAAKSKSIGDEGWMPANGVISGKLTTLEGGAPVPGALVEANLFVDGDYLTFSDVTDQIGNYSLTDIYYGEASTITITCTYEDHTIISQESAAANPQLDYVETTLDINNNSIANVNFLDKTAYAISGVVRHAEIPACFLDSIKVSRYYAISPNGIYERLEPEVVYTDENGGYTFIVNPELDNLDSIIIVADNKRLINFQNGQPTDSIRFDFIGSDEHPSVSTNSNGDMVISDFNLERITTIDFNDELMLPVVINVVNPCGVPLLASGETWSIRIRSVDGCFEKTYETNNQKTLNVELPPRDMIFTVVDVSNPSTFNSTVLNFLINNPVSFDLASIHVNNYDGIPQTQLADSLTANIEYHLPPMISPDFSDFDCTYQGKSVVQADVEYRVSFSVEEFFSPVCEVKTGYLRVINAASSKSEPEFLYFDESLNRFEDYIFTAGVPNPVVPHLWNLKVEYYSDEGVFQGDLIHGIFVQGAVSAPGNGIMTDAASGGADVPLPLYVLRDPPGDGSSSSISKDFESEASFSFSENGGGGAGAYAELDFTIFSIGAFLNIETLAGRYVENSQELTITTKTSQEISTSDAQAGDDASIVVGVGVAMQFGQTTNYSIECPSPANDQNFVISETKNVQFTPNALNTTWTYTVGFIKDLIEGYKQDAIDIAAGSKVLKKSNGEPYSEQEALDLVDVLRSNWESILNYYYVNTNPIYSLVNTDYLDGELYPQMTKRKIGQDLNLNIEANLWASYLLLDGIGLDSIQTLNQTELARYNNAATAIRELMDVRHYYNREDDLKIEDDLVQEAYDNWHFSTDRYFDTEYYLSVDGIGADEMARNRTFSGAITQSFSYGQTKSFNQSNNISTFFESNFKGGVKIENSVDIGLGIIKNLSDFDNKIGAQISGSYTKDVSEGSTNIVDQQVSYTLFDDDPEDEVSVSIFRGLDPNQTPYFQTLGGKTSCPYEEGTLSIDGPEIDIILDNGAATKYDRKQFQDPEGAAVFTIQITNNSATEDDRALEVYLLNESNPFGATIKLAGDVIGEKIYNDLEYGVPTQLILTVERGSSPAYDFTGIQIGIQPACGDDRFEQANISKVITLDVHFQSPCSPISIVSPGDNWLINAQKENQILVLRDYEPLTPNFEGVSLEYRRLGGGAAENTQGWRLIPPINLDTSLNAIPPAVLEDHINTFFLPGQTPEYPIVWTPENGPAALYPDGAYEIRAFSTCKEGLITNKIYSNVISGTIDRTRMQVLKTEPADNVWVTGDEISISFNKNVDCSILQDEFFVEDSLQVFINDTTLVTSATFSCLNNTLSVTVPDMSIYDGQVMTVSVENITDINGNVAREVDEFGVSTKNLQWSFLINTSKAYWEQDSIVVQLYEGDSLEITVGLRNTDFQNSLTNIALTRSTSSSPWLGFDNNNFNVNPGAVKPIVLTLFGDTVGTNYDTISVAGLTGAGRVPRLPIKLVTTKRPPYPPDWVVDGNQFPNSMTVVANYTIADGPLSTDTLDQITAWIDNTLRGVGRIQSIGDPADELYAAYITVYGSMADSAARIEFRVWDQSTDIEYNANVAVNEPSIIYGDNIFEGSSFNPRILRVDTNAVQYIHLNQGYTWISFNTELEDMSINHVLNGLTNLTAGDQVLTQQASATYIDSQIGWFSSGNLQLDTFSTEQAYMVYLQGGPDSIRMAGSPAARIVNKVLPVGTNWIGFPSPAPLLLEDAIQLNLSNVSQIKNKDISRVTDSISLWTDGLLTEMRPNEGYKLFVFGNSVLATIPDSIVSNSGLNGVPSTRRSSPADPNDASTWSLPAEDYLFTDVIPVVGKIMDQQEAVAGDGSKKVAAFINDEIRGVGLIENIGALNDSLFTLLIGKDDVDNGLDVKFYFYDGVSVSDSLVMNLSLLTNSSGFSLFNYLTPLIWNLDVCPQHLILSLEDSPLSGVYEAAQSITIIGNVLILDGAQVILSAPEVEAVGLEVELGAELEVLQAGCE